MAAIITRRKWLRQPQYSVGLDWSNAATGGMQFFHHFNADVQPSNLAGPNYALTASGSPARADAISGIGVRLSNASTQKLTFGTAVTIPSAASWTAFAYASWDTSGANTSGRLFNYRSSNGNTILAAGVGSEGVSGTANAPSFIVRDDSGALDHIDFSAAVTDGRPHLWILQRTGASLTAWLDNASASIGSGVGTGSYTTTAADCAYGVDPLNTALHYWNGSVYYAGLAVGNYWDASIIATLVENPWQLFALRTRRLYFAKSAGTGFSGTPLLGSMVKTGKVSTLTIGYEFVPSVGALIKTGQVPTLTRAFKFAPGAGSLIKTGQVPTLTRQFYFAPTAGALIKTGKVPVLTTAFNMTPIAGALVKSGHAPTLYAPMYPVVGNLLKTGEIPTLTISGGPTTGATKHSWFVKAIGVKTKITTDSQVNSDTGDTP